MRKFLQMFLYVAILCSLSYTNIQAQNNRVKLEEKLKISIEKDYFEQANSGWLYFPKKQQILIYGTDSSRFVSLETGEITKTIPPITKPLKLIGDLSPDETKMIFYNYYGKESELWDISNGKLIAVLPKSKNNIIGIKWSADNRYFMYENSYGSLEKENLIFDATSGKIATVIKTKYKAYINFSPDGKTVLTSEQNIYRRRKDLLKLWNPTDGKLINDFANIGKNQFVGGEFSPNGKNIVIRNGDDFSVLDINNGEIKFSFSGTYYLLNPYANMIAAIKEDFRGLTKHDEITLEIYDFETGKLLSEIKTGKSNQHQVETHQKVWSPDGKSFASAGDRYSENYEAEVWKIADGRSKFILSSLVAKDTRSLLEDGYDYYDRISFTPDSRYLIANNFLGKENQIKIWNAETGELLKTLTSEKRSLLLTSDSRYLTQTNKSDRRIKFYEIK